MNINGESFGGDISVNSVTVESLDPSQTLKTDGSKKIVSSDLLISDTTNLQTSLDAKLDNPFEEHILPDTTQAYDIGSASFEPRNIYVAGDIIKNSALYGVFGVYSQMTPGIVNADANNGVDIFNTTLSRGTLTAPADTTAQGATNNLRARGSLRVNGNNQSVQIQAQVGAVTVADTGVINLRNVTSSPALNSWGLDMDFMTPIIGAPGVAEMRTTGHFTWSSGTNGAYYSFDIDTIENTLYNTTTTQVYHLIITWADISANNELICDSAVVTKIF